ncbi:unnamed protein product, partial [Closterium sp. Naga37s-1]
RPLPIAFPSLHRRVPFLSPPRCVPSSSRPLLVASPSPSRRILSLSPPLPLLVESLHVVSPLHPLSVATTSPPRRLPFPLPSRTPPSCTPLRCLSSPPRPLPRHLTC